MGHEKKNKRGAPRPTKKSESKSEAITMDDMLTIAEAAEAIGKSHKTIRRYIDRGDLKAFIAGRRGLMVRESDVAALLRPFVPKIAPAH